MNQTSVSPLDQAREQLRAAEADRGDPRRHGLFWDANAWDDIFDKIVALESSRDHKIQEQIVQARKAAPTTSQLTDTPADAQTLDQQGIGLLRQARCDEAIELFQLAAAADPSWYQPLNDMAFCLYEQGKVNQAIEQWQAALALHKFSADANAGLGMALYVAGSRAEGLEYYRNAIDLKADYRNENILRSTYAWSDKAIADSQPLRAQLGR